MGHLLRQTLHEHMKIRQGDFINPGQALFLNTLRKIPRKRINLILGMASRKRLQMPMTPIIRHQYLVLDIMRIQHRPIMVMFSNRSTGANCEIGLAMAMNTHRIRMPRML
jgi:hypothetical protein